MESRGICKKGKEVVCRDWRCKNCGVVLSYMEGKQAGLKAPIVCAKAIAAEDHGTKSNVLPILIRM